MRTFIRIHIKCTPLRVKCTSGPRCDTQHEYITCRFSGGYQLACIPQHLSLALIVQSHWPATFELIHAPADKHRLSTAEAIYAAITPEDYAQLSKHCYLRLMGEPVQFPSTDEWKQLGRSIEELMPRGVGAVEPDDGSGCGDDLEQDLADLMSDDDGEADPFADGEANADWTGVLAQYDASQGDRERGDTVEANCPSESSNAGARVREADGEQHAEEPPTKVRTSRAEMGPRSRKLAKRRSEEARKREAKTKRRNQRVNHGVWKFDDESPEKRPKEAGKDAPQEPPNQISEKPDMKNLSKEDQACIRHVSGPNAEKGPNIWVEFEKVFLIMELRKWQSEPHLLPGKRQVLDIVDKGRRSSDLVDPDLGGTLDDQKVYERVDRFYRKFLKALSTACVEA